MVGLGLVAIVDIGGHGNMVTWNVRKIWFDTNEKRKCTVLPDTCIQGQPKKMTEG